MLTVGGFICLSFLTICQCRNSMVQNEYGYSNDAPYNAEHEYITHTIRVKMGTPLTLKCNHHHKNIFWEYKQCDAYYQGILCNTRKEDPNSWKKLNVLGRGKINIAYSNKTHNGIYRCKQKDIIRETFTVEVVGEDYDGRPPSVQTLKISNSSNLNQLMEFTVQCNVKSIVPPAIIWFKQCHGYKCEIDYDKSCYCHLDLPVSVHNFGNTYVSKINIFNARHQDSGVYACLAITEYGKDYKNVTISVPSSNFNENTNLILLLVVIPVMIIIAPISIFVCYYLKRRKIIRTFSNPTEQISVLMANSDKT